MKRIALAALLAIATSTAAHAAVNTASRTTAVDRALAQKVANDLLLTGKSHGAKAADFGLIEIPFVKTSKVANDYKANEIKGDSLYKGKTFVVSGKVVKISSDFRDAPVISFEGADTYGIVTFQARFAKSDSKWISDVKKGQQLAAVCRIDGEVIGLPMSSCAGIGDYADAMIRGKETAISAKLPERDAVVKVSIAAGDACSDADIADMAYDYKTATQVPKSCKAALDREATKYVKQQPR